MADDRARNLAEDAFNRLVAELDQGKSEAFNNYLAAMGRFHRYSWGNVGLIAYQRPTATHVAGIHTWNIRRNPMRSVSQGRDYAAVLFE